MISHLAVSHWSTRPHERPWPRAGGTLKNTLSLESVRYPIFNTFSLLCTSLLPKLTLASECLAGTPPPLLQPDFCPTRGPQRIHSDCSDQWHRLWEIFASPSFQDLSSSIKDQSFHSSNSVRNGSSSHGCCSRICWSQR